MIYYMFHEFIIYYIKPQANVQLLQTVPSCVHPTYVLR